MRPLLPITLLLLTPYALADGAGPPPGLLAPGQVWELTARPARGPAFVARHRVDDLIPGPPYDSDWLPYGTSSLGAGGSITFFPSQKGLSLDHIESREKGFQCRVLLGPDRRSGEGVLFSGSAEASAQQKNRAEAGANGSFRVVIAQGRAQGLGTCTLKRIR